MSVFAVIVFVAAFFTVKFYLARRQIEKKIYNSPSVVFLGAGEKAIKHISGHVSKHKDMHYAHHSKGILVAAHHSKVSKMNAKKLVYIFDSARPAKSQIKAYKDHRNIFGKILAASFGNARKFMAAGKVHDLSSEEGADKLKELIDSALST